MTPDPTMLPSLFVVARDHHAGVGFLFEARSLHDDEPPWPVAGGTGPDEYEVRPYDPHTSLPAFVSATNDRPRRRRIHIRVTPSQHPQHWDSQWRFVTTSWSATGYAAHMMTSPQPVPIIDIDAADLPCSEQNRITLIPARARDMRIWSAQWDAARVMERLTRRRRSDSSDSEVEPQQPTAPTPPPVALPPKFVADALIRDAVSRTATCPITMESLKADTAAVTACFHIFDRDAIAAWLARSNSCCAVCKQRTAVVPA